MEKRDYYEILEVGRDAGENELKGAYRRLAMKYHPDKNPEDEQAADNMKEINEAYAILGDPEKRRRYDIYGHAGLEGLTMDDIFGGIEFSSLFRDSGMGSFSFGGDIFDSLFGRGTTRTKEQRKAADLRYDLEVTLEEVAFGTEKTIEIPHVKQCNDCSGTGAKEGGISDCTRCNGTGQITTEQRAGYGVIRQISTCGNCRGKGRVITEPCEECKGKGTQRDIRKVSFTIPAGADDGYAIRIRGEGEWGGETVISGDLYVVLNIKKHPVFERRGDDIYTVCEISFTQAALGGSISGIYSLNGDIELDIPEGTQTGTTFEILGKGIAHIDGTGCGSEYVIVKVVTPVNLSHKEKKLLEKMEELRKQKRDTRS